MAILCIARALSSHSLGYSHSTFHSIFVPHCAYDLVSGQLADPTPRANAFLGGSMASHYDRVDRHDCRIWSRIKESTAKCEEYPTAPGACLADMLKHTCTLEIEE